jgi:hypothetical protein
MALPTYTKDPSAILDYGHDWTEWMDEGDEITASTWAAAPDADDGGTLITSNPTFDAAGPTTVWLAGGVAGESYTVTNHITTAEGRQDDRSFKVKIKER